MSAPVVTLGALAREMHAREDDSLVIEVPEGVQLDLDGVLGASLQDGQLRFKTPADRNRAVAHDVLRELGPDGLADGQRLFEAADSLWGHEIGRVDTASGRMLAAAAEQVDVLQLAAGQITGPRDAFEILHCVEAMLPQVNDLPLPSLVALVEAQHLHTMRDMAGGVFFGLLQTWLSARPVAATKLVALLLPQPRESTASLLGAGWIAWGAHDPVAATASVLEASSRPAPLNAVTLWVAGRMLGEAHWPGNAAADLEALILRQLASEDASVQNAAIAAASGLLHMRSSFDAPLRQLASGHHQEALANLAGALARHKAEFLACGKFFQWLPLCQHLGTQYVDALGRLDFALAGLLAAGDAHRDATLEFLSGWIEGLPAAGAKDAAFVEHFGQCAGKMMADAALLARVLTEWFLREGRQHAAAAVGLLSRLGRQGQPAVALNAASLDQASAGELRYLARRVLGFVIDGHLQLSLILSLLDARDAAARVHPLMPWLIVEEIGYDYPGTTIERLRTAAASARDDKARTLLDGMRAQLEAYMAALEQLPRLKELTPPASLRHELHKARAKQTQEAMRDAEANSVMRLISSQIHLKAGSGSFQYFQGAYSETTQLKALSYEVEMPRRDALDPVGNAYRLLKHRSVRKDEA